MCQAKPGPRCASHTRDELQSIKNLAKNNQLQDKSQLVQAQIEYVATKTGRKELDERIDRQKSILDKYAFNDRSLEAEEQRDKFRNLWALSESVIEHKKKIDDLITVDKTLKKGTMLREVDPALLRSAGKSPRITDSLAKKFIENDSTDYMVANNPNVSPQILRSIFEHGSNLGRRIVGHNPSIDDETREKIIAGSDTRAKAALATNPNLSPKHKEALFKQNFPSVTRFLSERQDNTDAFNKKLGKVG